MNILFLIVLCKSKLNKEIALLSFSNYFEKYQVPNINGMIDHKNNCTHIITKIPSDYIFFLIQWGTVAGEVNIID
jgi:hypothetical protein